QPFAQSAQKIFQLSAGQRTGSSASEVDRLRTEMIFRAGVAHFPQQSIQKLGRLVLCSRLHIEAAIRAELGAERDMEVKVADDHRAGQTRLIPRPGGQLNQCAGAAAESDAGDGLGGEALAGASLSRSVSRAFICWIVVFNRF